ncbi:MAG TPA: restriction endonuclease [Novosphingobium sp.]|nr:restriction endonuclease [Novosphingobium sp.]HMP55219.1 restriction endonuclease [Novosphingobium sp.]
MAIPDYQTLMLPVLTVAAEGEVRVPAAAARIADRLGLSEAEREEMLPSGKQRLLHNRVHWAKFYLAKAGLVDNSRRGLFVATQAGRDLLASRPTRIDVSLLKTYPSFNEFYDRSEGADATDRASVVEPAMPAETTPEEQIDAAHGVLTAALKADLLERIFDQSPSFFERLIVELLVAMGYGGSHEDAARQLGRSGDGGIDGIIDEDRLGLDRIYVQAKRYAEGSSVGRPEIQAFVGSLVGQGATKGVFVTTARFSSQAREYARALQQRIILIDGNRLGELMVEFNVGVRVSRVVEVKKIDEDFFSE